MKQLLSGNEAIARGIYEAGISVCSAYPGTPSTEILEAAATYGEGLYCEWAPNEKVAAEVAYGACVAGSRTLCAMKMVGVNVAADPLFSAAYMGVNGAYILVSADDPSCHSSQNEQDNRHYARAAKVAMVEPADSQECKDFVRVSCEISECFDTPVLFRTTTRINHSKSLVEFGETVAYTPKPYRRNTRKFISSPANAYQNHPLVEQRLLALEEYGNTCPLNRVEMRGSKIGVIAAGVAYQYAKEVFPADSSFLKLGLTYPLPMGLIRDFAGQVETLYVIEELDPFMEQEIKAAGIPCVGKELTGRLYELNPQLLRQRLFGETVKSPQLPVQAISRPPALCPGCPHRGFFYTLAQNKNFVVAGDIGCYTLGSAAPLSCMDLCLCMGGGFTAGAGMAKAFAAQGDGEKIVFGVMGDSTFFHSGMTGAAEIIYNHAHIIPCVLDNRITGMTGHQENPGTGRTLSGVESQALCPEDILRACGFQNILVVDPQDLSAMKQAVADAVASAVPAAIVTRRPCLLIKGLQREAARCQVDADKCRGCKKCLQVGCASISMEGGKARIDAAMCAGCTVCAQVCPFKAISRVES